MTSSLVSQYTLIGCPVAAITPSASSWLLVGGVPVSCDSSTLSASTPFPLAGAADDDFFRFRLSSKLGRDGFFEEDGELWGPDGSLVAQCRQLAIALPIR